MTVTNMLRNMETLYRAGLGGDEVVIALDTDRETVVDSVKIKGIYPGGDWNRGKVFLRGSEQIVRRDGGKCEK